MAWSVGSYHFARSAGSQTITGEKQSQVMIYHLCLDFIFIEIIKEIELINWLIVICWNHLAWTGIVWIISWGMPHQCNKQSTERYHFSLTNWLKIITNEWYIDQKWYLLAFRESLYQHWTSQAMIICYDQKKVSWVGEEYSYIYVVYIYIYIYIYIPTYIHTYIHRYTHTYNVGMAAWSREGIKSKGGESK